MMSFVSWLRRAFLFVLCLGCSSFLYGLVQADVRLTIGSAAPPLAVSDWIQNGDGKFSKVTQFEKGKVYVVEFWATWCGPCIQSMPHLAELQKKYADRGVQIISVSDETVEEVQEFLKRPAGEADGKPITFQELTSVYCLTTDPDGSTNNDYPLAAKINGIPCAFIVGKDAKIEWIGHPMEMDQPLEQVVAGKWNREAFAQEYNEEKEFEALTESLQALLSGGNLVDAKIDRGLGMIDNFLKAAKSPKIIKQARFTKFDLMIQLRPDDAAIVDVAKKVFEDFSSRPIELSTLTWGIYEIANAGNFENPAVLKEAIVATRKVLPKIDKNQRGNVLDTIAHLQFAIKDYQAALETAKEALEAPDATNEMKAFVQEIEKAIQEKDSKKK